MSSPILTITNKTRLGTLYFQFDLNHEPSIIFWVIPMTPTHRVTLKPLNDITTEKKIALIHQNIVQQMIKPSDRFHYNTRTGLSRHCFDHLQWPTRH